MDERLIGTWVRKHEKGKDFVHVGRDLNNGMKLALQEQASRYSIEVIRMFVAKIDDRTLTFLTSRPTLMWVQSLWRKAEDAESEISIDGYRKGKCYGRPKRNNRINN